MTRLVGTKGNFAPKLPVVEISKGDSLWQPERGSVTAELAVALPAVVVLLFTILTIAAAFGTQMRVSDAARTGARLFSMGYPRENVAARITEIAGQGAVSTISTDGEWATLLVERGATFGPVNLGLVTLRSQVTVWLEP